MICVTCRTEIPPAWTKCIEKNCCPACDGPIMDDFSKELLSELSSALERMPNNPSGLAGWLLSNYEMRKIGTGEPTQFFGNRRNQRNDVEVYEGESNPKPNIKNNPFFRNIKQTVEDPNAEISSALNQIKQNPQGKDYKMLAGFINSSDEREDSYENDEAEVDHILARNQSMLAGKVNTPAATNPFTMNPKDDIPELDLIKSPVLQADRMNRLAKQQARFQGGRPSFRRNND